MEDTGGTMAMGVLSVQQDRKKAEACSGRVFLLYELFRYGDDSAAAGTMRLVRGIIFPLSGLLLAGCMQSGPAWDANLTARDRQELANPPYKQATIPLALQRQVVQYSRQEPPGSILVDTDARYVYYVLPEGKAIRYGAIVGEHGQAPSGVAIVGRKEEWPGWTPTEDEKRRLGPLPNYLKGGAHNPMGARALYLYAGGKDTLYRIHGTNQPILLGNAVSSGCIRLTNEDVIDLYSRAKIGARVVVLGAQQS
jgi:lipoprotein-anchoring transpeptidase ErfK/SrfK